MFGKKKGDYPTGPAPQHSKKRSGIVGYFLGNNETPEQKKKRLDEEFEVLKSEAKVVKLKNYVEKEKITNKKLKEAGGFNVNVPDYLGGGVGPTGHTKLDKSLTGKRKDMFDFGI